MKKPQPGVEDRVWQYSEKCLDCTWGRVWVTDEPWERSGANKHRRETGHRVRVINHREYTLVPFPGYDAEPVKKKAVDTHFAFCPECQKRIGEGAGKMLRLAVGSHERASGHKVEVRPI